MLVSVSMPITSCSSLWARACWWRTGCRTSSSGGRLRRQRSSWLAGWGSLLFPGVVAGIDPTENPAVWELAAELAVIVVLFEDRLAQRFEPVRPRLLVDWNDAAEEVFAVQVD